MIKLALPLILCGVKLVHGSFYFYTLQCFHFTNDEFMLTILKPDHKTQQVFVVSNILKSWGKFFALIYNFNKSALISPSIEITGIARKVRVIHPSSKFDPQINLGNEQENIAISGDCDCYAVTGVVLLIMVVTMVVGVVTALL